MIMVSILINSSWWFAKSPSSIFWFHVCSIFLGDYRSLSDVLIIFHAILSLCTNYLWFKMLRDPKNFELIFYPFIVIEDGNNNNRKMFNISNTTIAKMKQ